MFDVHTVSLIDCTKRLILILCIWHWTCDLNRLCEEASDTVTVRLIFIQCIWCWCTCFNRLYEAMFDVDTSYTVFYPDNNYDLPCRLAVTLCFTMIIWPTMLTGRYTVLPWQWPTMLTGRYTVFYHDNDLQCWLTVTLCFTMIMTYNVDWPLHCVLPW